MSFWQELVDSYDKNAEALQAKYPLSTTSISNKADIIAVITVDGDGNFIRAEKIDKAKKDKSGRTIPDTSCIITLPISEKSSARSSTTYAPHPIFDQFGYVSGGKKPTEKQRKDGAVEYLTRLKDFANSEFATPQVKAIYKYISKKSVTADLSGIDVKDKTNIVFEVEIQGNPQTEVWKDKTFFDAWHQYYLSQKGTDKTLDYITGTPQPVAVAHPKKISNGSANAKLISDNDSKNFTYLGKFQNSEEAFSIGYESSQKAHQFLRYLIDERGFFCGEQVILSYTIGETTKTLSALKDTKDTKDEWDEFAESSQSKSTDSETTLRAETGNYYSVALNKALKSYCAGKALQNHKRTAVIALDAATTGRLSITFYRELAETDYLDKIADWHNVCKWHLKFYDEKEKKWVSYVGAPSVDDIISVVFGKKRKGKDESYTKIQKKARECLLHCIFDGENLPKNYVFAAVRCASNPMGIPKKDGEFDKNSFEQILSITCALIRTYYLQQRKEEYELSIDFKRTDRNYLYGRLLGAADKLEEYALRKKGKKRETAAIRYMQNFVQRPSQTLNTIVYCLAPYFQTVKDSIAWKEFQAIYQQFVNGENGNTGDFESKESLNESYILGYYHERAEIDRLSRELRNKQKLHNKQENKNA